MKTNIFALTIGCFLALLPQLNAQSQYYDFYKIDNQNDTLYYKITSDSTVAISTDTVITWATPRKTYTGDVNIPASVIYNNVSYAVTAIADYAFFASDSLTAIHIPNSIKRIGKNAFGYCRNLSSVLIPNSVVSIEYGAFMSCSSLKKMFIPNSVTELDQHAFSTCQNVLSAKLPDSLKEMPNIGQCSSLEFVNIPTAVKVIGNQTFYNCSSLKYVILPQNIDTVLGFEGASALKYIYIPPSTKYIYGNFLSSRNLETIVDSSSTVVGTYYYPSASKLTTVNIPNTVTTLLWAGYAPEGLSIPHSVTSIATNAFRSARYLKSIVIPPYADTIGDDVFNGCDSLTTVSILSQPDTLSRTFAALTRLQRIIMRTTIPPKNYLLFLPYQNTSAITLYVPCNSVTAYQSDTNWNKCTIKGMETEDIYDTTCAGIPYTNYGFNVSKSGIYERIIPTGGSCDSIITLHLTVNSPASDIYATICNGQRYTSNGFDTNKTGIYERKVHTINGCDSVIRLLLTVLELPDVANVTVTGQFKKLLVKWEGNADYYRIHRDNIPLGTTTDDKYIDTNVEVGQKYCYRIVPVSSNCEGQISDAACSDTIAPTPILPIQKNDNVIKIYPNPSDNNLTIEGENIYTIQCFDVIGRELKTIVATAQKTTIDISNFPAGMYILKIISNNKVHNCKIVKK
jgi:hypothetical protein